MLWVPEQRAAQHRCGGRYVGDGLPEIDLHDVRHSYATAGRSAKIDSKALSKRIGHADIAFTMKQYVQTDLEADRGVANTLAYLIIGRLPVAGIGDTGDEHDGGAGRTA
jgi:integrase